MVSISILGSGNVATHLISAFSKADSIHINQIYSRDMKAIQHFKNIANLTDDINSLEPVDLIIIAISDDAIPEFSKKITSKSLVVHTSGSVEMTSLLGNYPKGVFYPLQTFSKSTEVDFSTIPICLEADNDNSLKLLTKVASLISNKIYFINSNQRKKIHLAAVFVNNFTNHLYDIGNSICTENDIPFEILYPLIQETTNKIKNISPKQAQTGPARRNDQKTIENHLKQLSPQRQEIYSTLTKSIIKTYTE